MTTASDIEASFLPDMCGVRALFGVVIIGELLAVVLTLIGSGASLASLDRLSLLSLFIQWIGLSATAGLCVSRRWIGRLPETGAAIASYALILLIVYALSEVAWWVINPISGKVPLITIERSDFLMRTLGITAIVGALVLRHFYLQHHWKLRTVSEARARIDALQARIRPHFLFNCMNSIASLTRSDPPSAERAIVDLADLFRASLGEARSLVPLHEEFELVRGYLNIEGLRLGERLRTQWRGDDNLPEALIPQLSLQPLVENAIYHGIEPLSRGGLIEIDITASAASIDIAITNPLAQSTTPHDSGNRVALANVRERLDVHFGAAAKLVITSDDAYFRVVVTIPTANP